jgi:hypothetical protein
VHGLRGPLGFSSRSNSRFNIRRGLVLPTLHSDPSSVEEAIKGEFAVLYDGRISPYSSLLQIKHLANTLAYQERSTPNVFWQNHAKTCLIVNSSKLHIQAIRDLIH